MPDARLNIRLPGEPDREVKLCGHTSIGRAFDNSIRLEAKGVSRYHAIIEERDSEFWLSDLGSINGTSINDDPVTARHKLRDGDTVSVGDSVTFVFRAGETASQSLSDGAASAGREAAEAAPVVPAPPQPARSFPHVAIAVAAGLAVIGVVALVLVGLTGGGSNPTVARIISPVSGTTINEPVMARVKVENPKSVSRVIYELDGVEVASSETPPNYESRLDPDELKQTLLNLDGARKLSAIIEDKQGRRKPLSETVLLTFNLEQPDEGARPTIPSPDGEIGRTEMLPDTRLLVSDLAYQISKRRNYVFSPSFINQIERYIIDYMNVRVDDQTRREIAIQFESKNNLPSLLGLVLAMNQSVTREGAHSPGVDENDPRVGFFRLPKSVAKDYINPGEPDSVLDDQKRSIEIAARYTKDMVDKFRFRTEDFIYVIACFGMPINKKVGELNDKLNEIALDPKVRYDFWAMVESKVIDRDAANRVARFFAAGIAGQKSSGI